MGGEAMGQVTRVGGSREPVEVTRPGWVTFVGIMAILVGSTGIFGAYMSFMAPMMSDFMQQAVVEAEKEVAGDPRKMNSEEIPSQEEVQEMMETFIGIPDWYVPWSYASGFLKILVSGFYVLAAILLLLIKRNSLLYFYLALAASSLLVLVNFFVATATGSVVLIGGASMGFLYLGMNLVLLLVTLLSDRTVFRVVNSATR
jgi:hypothetical protein